MKAQRILVFQTHGIGDMLMTTPMIRAIRDQAPKAYLTVVAGTQASAAVVSGSTLCDEVKVIAPGQLTLPALLRRFGKFRSYDIGVVATRLSPRVGQLLRLRSGLSVVAGGDIMARPWGYTHWRRLEPSLHRVLANVEIARTVFPNAAAGPLYFHRDEASEEAAEQFWSMWELHDKLVLGIHSGSTRTVGDKRFPIETCKAFIGRFLETFPHARVLLLFGPDEADIVQRFAGADPRIVLDYGLNLRTVSRMIAKTRLLVAGDTGLGHVAASVGTPTVTLAGPTFVASTHPWGDHNTIVQTAEHLPCMPCYGTPLYGNCPYNVKCMTGISVDQILDKVSPYFQSSQVPPQSPRLSVVKA